MTEEQSTQPELVRDLMTVGVLTCSTSTSITVISQALLEKNVEAVVVLDDEGHAVGIVGRDELVQASILAVLQALFSVALSIFAQRVYMAFQRHGLGVASWVRWGCVGLVVVFAVVMLLRSYRNVMSIKGMRAEMRAYQEMSRNQTR